MMIKPVYGAPALAIELADERVLVVADLHLGIESELASKGIALPSQIPTCRERLLKLLEREKASRLIFLGDVKHNVPTATWQEWRELPAFFEELAKFARVEIVRGNHDGGIGAMVPPGVEIHNTRGLKLGKRKRVGLMHGHTWPSPELLDTETIVAAHNHPAVEFRDELGARTLEPVWLRCELDPFKLPKKLLGAVKGEPPELLVMPAFGELVGGAAVNRAVPRELLGPIFKAGVARIEEAEVYLLDGTHLGKVRDTKNLRREA